MAQKSGTENRIRVLPEQIANKIAAGEVIESPASVVKELMENSIDADATRIRVEVQGAGKSSIRVSDNGFGMSRDDALLAIERHATSKIRDVKDLDTILTMGFRGEAIPAIASVSRMVFETRRTGDFSGTRLRIEGGVLKDVSETGRDVGTDMDVKHIFYNMPARRKFMRSNNVEFRRIREVFINLSITYPHIAFELVSEGRSLYDLQRRSTRKERLYDVFGDIIADMVEVSSEKKDMRIVLSGFIGKPELARSSRTHQFLFVNNRPVVSRRLAVAVAAGYGSTVPRGLFPFFILYLELDPARVDVNVHPAKREVKFRDEYSVCEFIREVTSEALGSSSVVPNLEDKWRGVLPVDRSRKKDDDKIPSEQQMVPGYGKESAIHKGESEGILNLNQSVVERDLYAGSDTRREPIPTDHPGDIPESGLPLFKRDDVFSGKADTVSFEITSRDTPQIGNFWQVGDKYIFTTIKSGAIIIDQHAAHERVLYESVLHALEGRKLPSQQLIFPVSIKFTLPEIDVIRGIIPLLEQIGFGIEFSGETEVRVTALPAGISPGDSSLIREMMDDILRDGRPTSGLKGKLAAAFACKAAVKSGRPLSQEEMRSIVDGLFATETPFFCPHGRPTVIRMSLDDLDKRFGR